MSSTTRISEPTDRPPWNDLRSIAVLDIMPVMVWIAGPDRRFIHVNEEWVRFTGQPLEQSLGHGWLDVVHPDDREACRAAHEDAFDRRVRYQTEERLRRADGEYRWVANRAAPLHAPDGTFIGYIGSCVDITDQKQAESTLRESEELKNRIIESSGDCIKVLDLEGRLLSMSAGGQRLLELTDVTPLLNRSWPDEMWPAGLRAAARAAVEAARTGGTGRFVGCARTASGKLKWWDNVITPIRDATGKPERLLAISRDITDRKLAEDALRQSEAEFRAMFELSVAGMGKADCATGRLLQVNHKLCEMLGYSAAELCGMTIADITHPDDLALNLEQLERARRGEIDEYGFEKRYIRKDGQIIWAQLTASIFRDTEGRALHMVAVVQDITASKQAEHALRESEGRYRHLWENLNDAALMADAETGYLVETNKQAERLLGRSREELLRMHQQEIHPPDQAEEYRRRFAAHATWGREADYDGAVVCKDGSIVPVRITAAPIELGGKKFVLQLFHDITEQKRMEEKLKETDRRKDEFLAMLAHELRNPLAPIRNAVEILKRESGLQSGSLPWVTDVISRQVEQMTNLVDDLLDVARITRGHIQLQKEHVLLADVIVRAVETAHPLIQARNHALSVDLPQWPVWLKADPARLVQVVDNLLNNAAKYTPEGGRIRLTARCEGTDEVIIEVSDNGIGIPAALQPHIFELFYQTNRTLDRSQEGLGLGLYLVHTLVKMHGGRIEAISDGPGRGSTFIVHLPLMAHAPCAAPVSRVPDSADIPRRRVLVVDDNPDVANSFAMLLDALGHEVHVTHDGPSALAAARQIRPEILFLDIGLPGMNGYEVARRLRAEHPPQAMLLVAVTGYGQIDDCRHAAEAGFDHHLLKPVDVGILETLLTSWKPVN